MPDGLSRRLPASEMSATHSALAFAVFYRSDQAVEQFGPLQAGRVRVEFIRAGSRWTAPPETAGVLWELSLEDGAQRLVSTLIGNRPAASYSLGPQTGLLELSRTLGF